ncbi:MAG: hypothetical protein CMI09_12365 [Oceanospirillaceae bacterium]|nr:hypothetical protein [Oceanospirillaceae bacterium]|tara:strand:+ start:202 stop:963 length:762 start_codon:yes stop_codon:yes gene_type:complete
MLSALRAARWYLLLGFFAFIVFLAVNTPLHFLWGKVEPSLGRLPVEVKQVSGTVWEADFQIVEKQLGTLDGHWKLRPGSLLSASPTLDVTLEGQAIRFEGIVTVEPNQQLRVQQGSAYIDSSIAEPMLRKARAKLTGNIEANNLNLVVNPQSKQILAASGNLVFSGGDASFKVQGKMVDSQLPMMVGKLEMEGAETLLKVTNTDQEGLADMFLKPDGWGGVKVKRRFLDAIGQPWKASSTADTIVFEVSQKFL